MEPDRRAIAPVFFLRERIFSKGDNRNSAVREGSGDLGAIESPGKNENGHGQEDESEEQEDFDGVQNLPESGATEKSGAHGVEGEGHGIERGNNL
jgi:hypothetical protein